MTNNAFTKLPLSQAQFDALAALGYDKMTAVQAQSLPLILQGRDLIARARTGSGKTAAFGIGLLPSINPRFFGVQALILCPTRELAEQVSSELRRLASRMSNIKLVTLCGGKPFGPQVGSLEHGAHIVVGTPGRILDHLQKKTLTLQGLKVLVLDEADRMLDMGFADSMKSIIAETPTARQTLLFSATYPDNIRKMSASIQRSPASVTAEDDVAHADEVIEQLFYEVQKHERKTTLLALFEHYQPANAIVFCNTKKQCDEVAGLLREYDIQALAIHGDLEQRERDQVLVQFSNNSCPVLVATDVAARGLDIKSLALVVNYELPRDPEVYVHRIGRTGRAGEKGLAMSIVVPAETPRIARIEEYQKQPCACDTLPSLDRDPNYSLAASMVTLQLDAGRKQKLRPGDILGALTGDAGLDGAQVGKISIFDQWSFVAVQRDALRQAMSYLAGGKVKGRSIRARKLR
jgi:ATP-independent RNA helicase DbpA